jgi:hypothetical protein
MSKVQNSLSVHSEMYEYGLMLLGHFALGQDFFMFTKCKENCLRLNSSLRVLSFDKFLIRSKIGLVTNIRAKSNFMNLGENEVCAFLCTVHQQT